MDWLQALILGILQGLTEYLPVSSSGHLAIGSALFGLDESENLTFAVVVHAATVLSTIVVLWNEIVKLIVGLFKFSWNEETQYLAKIAVSMIPVLVVGLFFKDFVESIFGSGLLIVGIMLLVTSALLAFSYFAKPRKKAEISFRDAFIIGLAQAVAVLPGLSRSGATISTGLMLGNKKSAIARFSFLMVIVPILGEAFLDTIKGGFSTSSISATSLIVGFAAAFLSGALACRWMLDIVKKGKLIWFSYYCIAAGTIAIALEMMN